jgi:ABC-type transport system involved in cytochrome c biogenesis ATPase subunit
MAYSQDFRKSALRHLKAAQVLHGRVGSGDQPGCQAVAGYLFGLAGELAVKEIMRNSGIKPAANRRDDPFFAHFPALKTMLSTAEGLRSGELRKVSEDTSLFQHWDTDMRYAPTKDIDVRWVDAWKASAEQLIDRMGGI